MCVFVVLLSPGLVLSVVLGWAAGQQLVGTECLGVFDWSQVLRFQEVDVDSLT